MDENRAQRVVDALRERGVPAHLERANVGQFGVRIALPDLREAIWDTDGSAGLEAQVMRDGVLVGFVPNIPGSEDFTESQVVDAIAAPGLGGVVTFTGVVRGETKGRGVVRLEYEAYREMAERALGAIAETIAREHGVSVAMIHRVGTLLPGDAAVVIACASAHRTAAFRACEACIERLKRDVPIWKREVFEDGSEWVGLGP